MPAWIYALAVVAVLWAVFVAVFHPFRRGAHAAPRALPVRVDAGSMMLAEEPPWRKPELEMIRRARRDEQKARLSAPTLTAPLLDPWRPLEPACRADLGGRCVKETTLVPLGGQLGPRARDVLDGYNARCVERWGHAIAG